MIPGAGLPMQRHCPSSRNRPFRDRGGKEKVCCLKVENIEVMRDGDQRWLLIKENREDIWFQVVEFWRENGILLEEQDPTVGIIVTGWLENLEDISSDFITDTLEICWRTLLCHRPGPVPAENRKRNLTGYHRTLSDAHRGCRRRLTQDGRGTVERTGGNPREPDPGLEAAMLGRIMVYLAAPTRRQGAQLAGAKEKARKPGHA